MSTTPEWIEGIHLGDAEHILATETNTHRILKCINNLVYRWDNHTQQWEVLPWLDFRNVESLSLLQNEVTLYAIFQQAESRDVFVKAYADNELLGEDVAVFRLDKCKKITLGNRRYHNISLEKDFVSCHA